MPGMTCKVELVPYLKKDAITVPPKALGTEETDEEKRYVYRLDDEQEPSKHYVTVGKKTTKKVEILEGLCEGDVILAECPNEEKTREEEKKKKEEGKEEEEKEKEEKEADASK
jgi:hypothetical protein